MIPIIGLAGVAKAGKDTMYKALREVKPGAIRLSIGDIIRQDCDDLIYSKLRIRVTDPGLTPEQKEIVRPLLVGYGLMMRRATKGQYFIQRLEEMMKEWEQTAPTGSYFVITDVRFDEYANDEVDWIQSKGGAVVHLTRDLRGPAEILANEPQNIVQPDNLTEAENDPKIRRKANYCHLWASQSSEFHQQQHAMRVLDALEPMKLFQ